MPTSTTIDLSRLNYLIEEAKDHNGKDGFISCGPPGAWRMTYGEYLHMLQQLKADHLAAEEMRNRLKDAGQETLRWKCAAELATIVNADAMTELRRLTSPGSPIPPGLQSYLLEVIRKLEIK